MFVDKKANFTNTTHPGEHTTTSCINCSQNEAWLNDLILLLEFSLNQSLVQKLKKGGSTLIMIS